MPIKREKTVFVHYHCEKVARLVYYLRVDGGWKKLLANATIVDGIPSSAWRVHQQCSVSTVSHPSADVGKCFGNGNTHDKRKIFKKNSRATTYRIT